MSRVTRRAWLQGVVGILVIAPYYGPRQPAGQRGWFLQEVRDAFLQAWAVALEATALLHWARQRWRVPLAATGVSYGAAMAALTSKLYPGPLAVVPFMGCSGPGEPFAHGARRQGLPADVPPQAGQRAEHARRLRAASSLARFALLHGGAQTAMRVSRAHALRRRRQQPSGSILC